MGNSALIGVVAEVEGGALLVPAAGTVSAAVSGELHRTSALSEAEAFSDETAALVELNKSLF